MKSGCLPLPGLTSWADDTAEANSTTASSPAAGSRKIQRANRFANMVFSLFRLPKAAPLTFATNESPGHREPRYYYYEPLRAPFVALKLCPRLAETKSEMNRTK